jgi:hypothetical protein
MSEKPINHLGNILEDNSADPNTISFVGVRYKPIVLGPGQSIFDLSFEDRLLRGIDWETTAKASAMIYNIGNPDEPKSS